MGAKKSNNSKSWFLWILLILFAFGFIGSIFTDDNNVNNIYIPSSTYSNVNTNTSAIENKSPTISVTDNKNTENAKNKITTITLSDIPEFSGKPYIEINNNIPYFNSSELTSTSFEKYSNLDSLGRCGVAFACIGTDIMPTTDRGEIGSVKPSGWHTVKYNGIDGNYLYNRCHLIGYQLAGENANEKNLITGTRYLNIQGMLPFENKVTDYIKNSHHHVMYRVTPIFEGNNLVASGVLIEAQSVEDNKIKFNVYCYNVQPGIEIDYSNGNSSGPEFTGASNTKQTNIKTESKIESSMSNTKSETSTTNNDASASYILNTNTKKFHRPSCASAKKIKDSNRDTYDGNRQDLINMGYDPCKNCAP